MNLRGHKHSVHYSPPWRGNQPRRCLLKRDVFDPCMSWKETEDHREIALWGNPFLLLPHGLPALGRPADYFSPKVRRFIQGNVPRPGPADG